MTARREWDLLVSPRHLDEPIDSFPVPIGAIEVAPGDAPPGLPWLIDYYVRVADAAARADRPLLLAGDCLTALGVVNGLQRRHDELAVVWLDAHGDFNTPAISRSGYYPGMTLAMVTGRAPQPLCGPLGLRPVPDDRVVLLDARDLDPAERESLDASGVTA